MATGTLTSTTIAARYKSLLKITGTGNDVLATDTVAVIEDGDGNDSSLSLSQQRATITLGSGAADDFIVDGTTLVVEGDNNRVGIGTTAPIDEMHLAGADDDDCTLVITAYDTDTPTNSPNIKLFRARGTQDSPSIVADNDDLGVIYFGGYIGSSGDYYTNYEASAAIVGRVQGTPSNADDDLPTELAFYTNPDGADDLTQRMTILSDGKVGIGTASPLYQLHLEQSAGGRFALSTTEGTVNDGDKLGEIYFRGTDSGSGFPSTGAMIRVEASAEWGTTGSGSDQHDAPAQLQFHTQDNSDDDTLGTPRMTISDSGNVGIGTIAPDSALEIAKQQPVLELSCWSTDESHRGRLVFQKSGNATVNTLTPTEINEDLGAIEFFGVTNNGGSSAAMLAASITCEQDAAKDATAVTGRLMFSTSDDDDNGTLTERMRIDDAGNVGIGTDDPVSALQVISTLTLGNAGNDGIINTPTSLYVNFDSDANATGEKFQISANRDGQSSGDVCFTVLESGKVGIGLPAPLATLHVQADPGDNASLVSFYNTHASIDDLDSILHLAFSVDDTCQNGHFIQFGDVGDANFGAIHASTDGEVNTSGFSDYRRKENIVPLTKGLAEIVKLNPIEFNFKGLDKVNFTKEEYTSHGFIAHEVQEAGLGRAVTGEKDATRVDKDGNTVPHYQMMNKERLIPAMVKAIQELSAKVTALENA